MTTRVPFAKLKLLSKRPQVLLSTLLALFLIPVAHAQPAEDQGLAASMAKALDKAKVKTVVVFDLMGPDDKLNQLGQDLADRFSHSLANSGGKFDVIDRTQVRAVIEKNRVAPDVIRDSEIAWWLARQLNADALIVGKLSPADGNRLQIAIAAAKTKDGKDIASMSITVAFTDEMMARISKSLSDDHTKDRLDPGVPKSYFPKCISCPRPNFSDAALANKKEGTVVLIVLIGEDGVARNMDFVKTMPYGMTQQAIQAVEAWKFKPGLGPDGKPGAVWQIIEVSFHLY